MGASASPCKYMIQGLSFIYSYRIRIVVLSLIEIKDKITVNDDYEGIN